ncbi:GNAT family N-acetyltransferase [Paenarthrobacter aurescens]|uniref:Putative N-acetyltransferase YobR n=1 Tax=Paenarthrobacter aurescens TaxID=43663 RepID=A0A4Y3NDR4_PAEAU|nr:GNAT family N-acetyltransferase [Paenarthrobacter aurescens]MDO6143729.1 GNAT family N-acetyltransferase [Paenarthrobacter aurescens]MDO6147577.1 GNAT family N-acetyltransferase [Paenarthrobacter aurescens]MDO6158820.1 GNAT family N-acetyltransferase [Paenarthrobacter aurescens]MDO6162804.1 GNAT family N-acetyltransferase [Paenarthrobacter aurescens]GEB19383.1 putative N-acetyltransferase YobR [Paenarthrobacter aurescens]
MLEQAFLESLMDKAWPGLEREVLNLEDPEQDTAGEWVLRASSGVTQRANSVWPRNIAGGTVTSRCIASAVRAAGQWYRLRRLPLIFQVFDDPGTSMLNAVLDQQRFTRQSATKIMIRGVEGLPVRTPGRNVELSREPSGEWLRLWWSVDGRGGEAELEVAQKVLTACPALYAMVRNDDGVPAAVGRLALVDGWGGIYSMATSAAHRRRGYGTEVLAALMKAGTEHGLEGFWLLVTEANRGAQSLYAQAGFNHYGSYLYRQAPLQRTPSGC